MSTHFCKVGTVRPNLNEGSNSTKLKSNSVDQKAVKVIQLGKLSKKIA